MDGYTSQLYLRKKHEPSCKSYTAILSYDFSDASTYQNPNQIQLANSLSYGRIMISFENCCFYGILYTFETLSV